MALTQEKFLIAEDYFEPLMAQEDFPLANEAEWYLALARLGSGQVTTARPLLRQISADLGHPRQGAAKALLKKLP
ncbi:MAG: hypothetical protein HC821_03640 [Lewinella sp.]|nr:hypothetical protein [Lewinella sp.]